MALESFVFEGLYHFESRMYIRPAEIPTTRFSGGLFPLERGLSPNKVFGRLQCFTQFLILCFYSESRLLGAVLSGCRTLINEEGFEHFDPVSFQETLCASRMALLCPTLKQ